MRRVHAVGAAVIGSGFIGAVHIEALRRLGVDIRGLLEASPDLGVRRAAELGLPRAYNDLADLLNDQTVEIVHVTSPNALHFPQVKAILAAGRHVICEKPLAVTSAESAELVRLAKDAGRINAINFNIRFYPLNQHVARMVADGGIGTPRFITGHYFQDWLLKETDWNWRLEPEQGGALRAVGDIGSHWLDLTSFLSGDRISAVMADLETFVKIRKQPAGPVLTFSTDVAADTIDREIRTEDVATILLRYESGARGLVAVSQVSPGRKNSLRYEIDGSVAAVSWVSEEPDHLWIGRRDEPNQVLMRNPALMNAGGAAAASLPGGHVEGFADTFKSLFRAIYTHVAAGAVPERPNYPTFLDGHAEMLVNDAVLESANSGRWVDVAPAG